MEKEQKMNKKVLGISRYYTRITKCLKKEYFLF